MDVSFQQSPLLGRLEVRPGCTVSPRNLGGNNPTLNLEAGKDYFVQNTGLSLGDRRTWLMGDTPADTSVADVWVLWVAAELPQEKIK